MKFTYSWLKEHLDTDLSLAQLDEAMTMAGLEIEEIEALPVVKGIKYAANLWMHLYDFRGPSRAGLCPFLGQNTNG